MNVSKNLQNQFVKKYSKNYFKLTENVRNEDKWDSVEKKEKPDSSSSPFTKNKLSDEESFSNRF